MPLGDVFKSKNNRRMHRGQCGTCKGNVTTFARKLVEEAAAPETKAAAAVTEE